MSRWSRAALGVGLAGSAALSMLSAYAWYARYFRWVDCFNEQGRCYDPDGSGQVYTTSGQVWALPALASLCLTAGIMYLLLRARRR